MTITGLHKSALDQILRAMEKDLKERKKPAERADKKGVDDEKNLPKASPTASV
jgi:hypothetical protein